VRFGQVLKSKSDVSGDSSDGSRSALSCPEGGQIELWTAENICKAEGIEAFLSAGVAKRRLKFNRDFRMIQDALGYAPDPIIAAPSPHEDTVRVVAICEVDNSTRWVTRAKMREYPSILRTRNIERRTGDDVLQPLPSEESG